MDRQPNTHVRLDLCPRCRHILDHALDNYPLDKIYIRADPYDQSPSDTSIIIPLCEHCSKFVTSVLKLSGFTIIT